VRGEIIFGGEMAKKATTRKATAKTTAKKKTAATTSKDAAAFVDHLHENAELRSILKKGWEEVIRRGKKKGFKFTKQQLHDQLKNKYNVTSMPEDDEPDTCLCI
jgi:hypothetical protein